MKTSKEDYQPNTICLDVSDLPEAEGLKPGDEFTVTAVATVTSNKDGTLDATLTEPEIEIGEDNGDTAEDTEATASTAEKETSRSPALVVLMGGGGGKMMPRH